MEENNKTLNDAEFVSCQVEEDAAYQELIRTQGSLKNAPDSDLARRYKRLSRLRKNLYKRLYNKHQEEFRQSWFESSGAESVHQQLLANTAKLDEDELQLQSDEKFTDADMLGKPDPYLQPYFPHRYRIAQFF